MDEARARTLLLQAVERGHPLSRMWMARALSRGRMGIEQDRARARTLADSVIEDVERLADGGTWRPSSSWAPPTTRASVGWWLRAALQGDALTQLRLGQAYENGRGVPRDLEGARAWYEEAASRGNTQAAEALERLGG